MQNSGISTEIKLIVTMQKIFLMIFLFFCVNISFSQSFPFQHYTNKEGLCNSNVYYMLQNKKGYMWFATNNGLSRFDGFTFQNYSYSDGLNSNNLTGIVEGSDSTIYIGTFNKGINTLKNGIFSDYTTKDTETYTIHNLIIQNDTLYTFGSGYLNYTVNNEIRAYFHDTRKSPAALPQNFDPIKVLFGSDNRMFAASPNGIFDIRNHTCKKLYIQDLKDTAIYTVAEDSNNNLWLGAYGRIYKVKNNKVTGIIELDTKERVNKILIDRRGIVWFGIMNTGLFFIKENKVYSLNKDTEINRTPITQILEDNQGNIWVSTSGKGIFCFNNLFITHFSASDGLTNNNVTSLLVINGGRKLIGTFDGLNIFKNEKFQKINSGLPTGLTDYIYDIKNGHGNSYIVCASYNYIISVKNIDNQKFLFLNSYSGIQFDSTTVYIASHMNYIRYYYLNGNNFINSHVYRLVFGGTEKPIRINKLEKGKNGSIWAGTSSGLCRINCDNGQYFEDTSIWVDSTKTISKYYKDNYKYFNDNFVLNNGINSVLTDNSGKVWAAGEKGISVILPDDKIISAGKTPDFDLSSSTSLAVDKSNNLWVGNLKGLYRIPVDSFLNNNISGLILFDEKNGLPSSEVKALAYDSLSNELWIGTGDGLAKMELYNLEIYLNPPPKVIINNIQLQDTTLAQFNNLVFKPHQNNIKINFTSTNYRSPRSIKYEYKLGEGNTEWINTANTNIELASLSPGDYYFLIRAKDNNSRSDITILRFTLKPPFTKTIWFYLCIFFIFAALVISVSFRRVRNINRKAKEKIEIQNNISSLKHQALSASMNPHFIFNTLNSIQYYISTHNHEESNEFIVNFSHLIRMNLDHAANTFILLETELQRLELYLRYEKIRLEQKLNYEINIDSSIDPQKLKIPNMILQPFVENSLWHGLSSKKDTGTVSIGIRRDIKTINSNNLSVIIITISDNGIGLEEASKHANSKHISKGISIIKERLELLANEIKNYPFITVKERDDNQTGTIVTITLTPGQYKENPVT
jgi:ligand-binding sensor domain-containing protein